MFLNLDLRSLLVTDTGSRYATIDYLRLRHYCAATAFAIIAGISLCLPTTSVTQATTVIIIGAAKAVESLSDIRNGLLQRAGRHKHAAQSVALRGTLSALTVTVAIYLTGSILAASAAILLSWLSIYVLLDKRRSVSFLAPAPLNSEPRTKRILSLLRLSLPMGVTMLLVSLQTSLPRLFLEAHHSASDLGIFAALSYPWALGSLAVRSVASAAAPRYRDHLAASNRNGFISQVFKMTLLGIGVSMAGIFAAMLIGETILELLYTPEYAYHQSLFVWLAAAAGLGYLSAIVRHATVALRRIRSYMFITIAATALQLAACAALIEPLGLFGAALSNIILGAVQLIGSVLLLHMALRREGDLGK